MPNMDYSLIQRTPDGTGKILVTTPGSPDKGSYVLESDMKIYTNQGMVAIADIVDDLVTADAAKPLSANQGVVLKQLIDAFSGGIVPKGDILSSNLPPADASNKGWQYYCTDINQWATSDGTQWIMTSNNVITQTPDATDTGHALSNAVVTQCCNEVKGRLNQHESRLENLEQKAGDYTTVQYRGTNAVPTGKAKNGLVEKIVGKSRAWNQLALELSDTYYGATNATVSYSDHIATITATQEGGRISTRNSYRQNLFSGHTYLAKADIFLTTPTNLVKMTSSSNLFDSSCLSIAGWQTVTKMLTVEQDYSSVWLGVRDNRSANWDVVKVKNLQLFDLTLIFGAGNEPSTVADALALLPALGKYNAYDDGSLVSTEVSGVESRDTSDNLLDTLSLSETVTLRSAGSVADTDELNVEVNGVARRRQTTRIGRDDLGSLDWTVIAQSEGQYNMFQSSSISSRKAGSVNLLVDRYVASNKDRDQLKDKEIVTATTGSRRVCIRDDSFNSDADAFKTAMDGVMLNYELETPVVTLSDPIIDNFIEVEGGGTVETIQEQTPVIDNCLDVGYLTV